MKRLKAEGKVFVQTLPIGNPAKAILDLEMWLNGYVASEAYKKFGVALRVHLTLKKEGEEKETN